MVRTERLVQWVMGQSNNSFWTVKLLIEVSNGGMMESGHGTPKCNNHHIEYFELKEFWENGRSVKFTLIFSCPSPLKQLINPHVRGFILHLEGKSLLISKMERDQEESKHTALAKWPPVYYTYLIPFFLTYLSTAINSSSNLAENTQV